MKEELKPVDLANLEGKVLTIVDCFRKANNHDRSKEYRAFHLKKAESISKSLLEDFGYYLDDYKIGGSYPYGLGEQATK